MYNSILFDSYFIIDETKLLRVLKALRNNIQMAQKENKYDDF